MKLSKRWYGMMVLLMVFTGVSVLAQNPMAGRRMGMAGNQRALFRLGAFLRGLDLSDVQKDQIKSILTGVKSEFQATVKEQVSARSVLQETLRANPDNQEIWHTAFKAVTDAEWKTLVVRERVRKEIYKVLTPEQIAKLEARHTQMRKKARGILEP